MNKVKETFYSNFFDIGTEVNSALYQRNKNMYLSLPSLETVFNQANMPFQSKISKRNETMEISEYFWIQEVILVVSCNITM